MHARITVKWTAQPIQIFNFANIVDTDISFYDDIFWSRVGYADFTLKFAFDPIKKPTYPNDEIGRFSRWWHSLNKNHVPKIFIELFDGTSPEAIANGNLYDWEENREDFEVSFTCIDEMKEILDEQVNKNAITYTSDEITAVEQPSGPGNPPGEDDVPPIIPPGLPTISYHEPLQNFFWNAFNQWWNDIRGQAPAFIMPISYIPPAYNGLAILGYFVAPINQKLQSLSSGQYRVQLRFKKLTNIERKEVLSDISKLTKSKIVCSNGIHFIANASVVNITGYIQSVNSNTQTEDIADDKILDSIILQRNYPYYDDNEQLINNWVNFVVYTNEIKQSRNNWLQDQIKPRTEYNIWGYANTNSIMPTGCLQAGYQIRLENEVYKIKEISYEAETMHSITSFEAVCIR